MIKVLEIKDVVWALGVLDVLNAETIVICSRQGIKEEYLDMY